MSIDYKKINRKYRVEPYQKNWVNRFEEIKSKLKGVFKDKVISLEHIGSTSIPGMSAKPVIDVLIVVEDIDSFEKETREMEKMGYTLVRDYIAPRTIHFFALNEKGEKMENIHICEKWSPKERQFITMRNYLRAHPERAKVYSDLKEKNYSLYPNDYVAYREAKSSLLQKIEQEAYAWESKKA